jgi:hypothetical protein
MKYLILPLTACFTLIAQGAIVLTAITTMPAIALPPPKNREANLTSHQKMNEKLIPWPAGEFIGCTTNSQRSRPLCYELTFSWYKSDWNPKRRGYEDFKKMITVTEGCVDKFRPVAHDLGKILAENSNDNTRMSQISSFKAAFSSCEAYLIKSGWKEKNRFNMRNRMISELAATALYREIINSRMSAPTDDPEGFAYAHFFGSN